MTPKQLAVEVAWMGHMSEGGVREMADHRWGVSGPEADRTAALAVIKGYLVRVPRLGGYVAGESVNTELGMAMRRSG